MVLTRWKPLVFSAKRQSVRLNDIFTVITSALSSCDFFVITLWVYDSGKACYRTSVFPPKESLCLSLFLCLSVCLSLPHTHTHTEFCNSFFSHTEQAPTRSREAQNQLMKKNIGKKPRLFHSYKIYHSVELRNLHTYTIGAHAQTNLNIFARATFSSNETKYAFCQIVD